MSAENWADSAAFVPMSLFNLYFSSVQAAPLSAVIIKINTVFIKNTG